MARPKQLVNRDEYISFRVTPLEKKVIENIAETAGLQVSDFVRKAAMNKDVRIRFSEEELSIYKDLHAYHENFRRISNLVKSSQNVSPDLKREIKEVRDLINEHLTKFKTK